MLYLEDIKLNAIVQTPTGRYARIIRIHGRKNRVTKKIIFGDTVSIRYIQSEETTIKHKHLIKANWDDLRQKED